MIANTRAATFRFDIPIRRQGVNLEKAIKLPITDIALLCLEKANILIEKSRR
jgi:hypothetical protein